jgi:hypothetical protein
VGTTALVVSIINSRKTIFINSITSSRLKYIQEIRNSVSEYCGLFYRYKILFDDDPKISNEKLEILRQVDKSKYQIMLYLNPDDRNWDEKVIKLVEELRENINENQDTKIKELILITQYLLKLEWEGAKKEARKGIIDPKEKDRLGAKYYNKYLNRIGENKN